MPLVTLTDQQMDRCHVETLRRQKETLNSKQKWEDGKNRYAIDLVGCLGELAVSLYTNLEWVAEGNDKDVGDVKGLEVRTAAYQDKPNPRYTLCCRPKDKDAIYVLCIAKDNQVVVAGWASKWQVMNLGKPVFQEGTYGLERSKLYKMEDLQEVLDFESRAS